MDGYLKIKTKIDNKDVDKGITELENKIKKAQTDNLGLDKEATGLQEEINQYEKLCNEADKYKEKIKQLEGERKNLTVGGLKSTNVPKYNSITTEIDLMKQKYEQSTSEIDKQASKVDKVYAKLNKIKAKQTENNIKIQEFKDKIESIKINKVQNQINNIGKGIQNQIGQIGKMAFAIIGIRTACNAVRSAINIVSQYNSQISTDLEYMRYCIANALLPVVQSLTKLLYTALSYINAISTAWFGINLFSNSSAKNFQKMKNSASGTAKSAKEIQKSLQGFDEMNVLQDSSSSTGGETGFSTPSMDLSNMQGEVPSWLKWIIDNKDLILSILSGIAIGILAIKLGLGELNGLLIGLIVMQIVDVVMGITKYIGDIIDFIKNPSWENFSKMWRSAIESMGIVGDMILWIVDNVFGGWDNVTTLLQTVGTWIYDNVIKPVEVFFQDLWNTISKIFSPVIEFFSNIWGTVSTNIGIVVDNIKQIFIILWNKLYEIFSPVAEWFGNIFSNAYTSIKNVFSSIGTFFSGIWNKIKGIFKNIGQKIGQAVSGAFKSAVNAVLRTMENILNSPIRAINGLIGVINNVPGINLGYLNTFSLPRLAKGGVISQPTQAIIGEEGKEAVVPLENNMEWLDMLADKLASKIGTSAGSYIINLDGRTIQRGQAKKRQELAFATNGR